MKVIHTADWHIGKKLNGFDLLEEQQIVFQQILQLAIDEQVSAIIIAGDIYDRSIPPKEAIHLFQEMMIQLNIEQDLPILAISGNHDSGTRLGVNSPWLKAENFHLHTQLAESFESIVIEDTQFFLLPYFEPFDAKLYFQNDSLTTIELAMEAIVEKMQRLFLPNKKHVLVSHFFVAGGMRGDSETQVEVGGLESVSKDLLACFDYVALGHLHSKNAIKAGVVRYSGALLKYAVSEASDTKGVLLLDTDQFDQPIFYPVKPLHDLTVIESTFEELINPNFYQNYPDRDNYLVINLQDTKVIPKIMQILREIYPRLLMIQRVNGYDFAPNLKERQAEVNRLSPDKLFAHYYQMHTNNQLSDYQQKVIDEVIQKIGKE